MDCTVLKQMNLTAGELLRHRALSSEQYELRKKEQRDRKELSGKSEKLKRELETAKKTVAKLKKAVRGSRTSQSTRRRTAERGNNSGSVGSPEVE